MDSNGTPPLVETIGGEYLLEALFEAGPAKSGMMEPEPLGWNDVYFFAQATGDISEPWEMKALFRMSKAYLDGLNSGKNAFALSPLQRSLTAV
jgi:hypothetical protein